MNLPFRRGPRRRFSGEAPRGAVRNEIVRDAYDHDCDAGHTAACQIVDRARAVVWTTFDGRQLTEGPEFDRLETIYQGGDA